MFVEGHGEDFGWAFVHAMGMQDGGRGMEDGVWRRSDE